jgi:hypothetical protein
MLLGKLSKSEQYANTKAKKKSLYSDRRASGCCVACGKGEQSKARCDGCAVKVGTKFRWADDGQSETIIERGRRPELGKTAGK